MGDLQYRVGGGRGVILSHQIQSCHLSFKYSFLKHLQKNEQTVILCDATLYYELKIKGPGTSSCKHTSLKNINLPYILCTCISSDAETIAVSSTARTKHSVNLNGYLTFRTVHVPCKHVNSYQ